MSENQVQFFISTDALADKLGTNSYKVLDLRDIKKFKSGHIKGAIYIDNQVFTQKDEDGLNILPDREILQDYLQHKGINNDDTLIFVDDVFNLNCSLAAWTLQYFGFENVILLDGAFSKWVCDNQKLTTTIEKYPTGNIELIKKNEDILITKDDILMNIKSSKYLFVDNRSEYALLMDQQGGNIPGAVHFWYLDLFVEHPDYFILHEKEKLLDELNTRGILPDKSIVVYCDSAPQSALVYLVLKDLGYPDVKLYLAGFDEWRIICTFF